MSFKVTDIFRLINTKADLLKIMMFLENASLVLIKKLKNSVYHLNIKQTEKLHAEHHKANSRHASQDRFKTR